MIAMIIGKSLHIGETPFVPNDDPIATQRLTEIHAKNRYFYDSNAPLFTREEIRSISQQLKKLEGRNGNVSVRGLDGTIVEFPVETGRVLSFPPVVERVIEAPFIYYCSIQELTSINYFSAPRTAHCSLRIYHYSTLRSNSTKENSDVVPLESLEDTSADFKSNRQQWEESEQCKQLTSTLQSINVLANVRQIVAFACGSIRRDSEQGTPRSSYQHALILTLRNILGKNQGDTGGILCYAQDPAYSKVDKLILEESNIAILDDPEAFLKVDDSTIVFSCSPEVPVKQIVSDIARPAAMIWNRVREHDRDGIWADPDSSRVRKMISDEYDIFEVPYDMEHFGDLALYVKRAAADIMHVEEEEEEGWQ